jgi:hypothetical protein
MLHNLLEQPQQVSTSLNGQVGKCWSCFSNRMFAFWGEGAGLSKLLKAANSFVTFVCLHRKKKFSPTGRIFMKVDI